MQRCALPDGDFKQALLADPDVTKTLSRAEIDACFDLSHALRYVDEIIDRALEEGPP